MKATMTAALAGMVLAGTMTVTGSAAAAPADAGVVVAAPEPVTEAAVAAALSKVGATYAAGAAGPDSFDCSGLVMWALARADIRVAHSSFAQYALGTKVGRSGIRRGDLVFFETAGAGASHVGIATSDATAVSATDHGVMTHPIFDAYWGGHFIGARRLG
jgi:peptidoglycan DL-endopeptidase CwlO